MASFQAAAWSAAWLLLPATKTGTLDFVPIGVAVSLVVCAGHYAMCSRTIKELTQLSDGSVQLTVQNVMGADTHTIVPAQDLSIPNQQKLKAESDRYPLAVKGRTGMYLLAADGQFLRPDIMGILGLRYPRRQLGYQQYEEGEQPTPFK